MSGSDIVARIAAASEPRSITTCVALSRSTDTARKGVGSSSKLAIEKYCPVIRASIRSTCSPVLSDVGGENFPFFTPNSSLDG